MKGLKYVFVVIILLHVPINMFAARDMMYTTFGLKRTTRNHYLISLGITYLAFIVPILYPSVLGILGLFGGVFAASVCLLYPFLIGIRLREQTGKGGKLLISILVVFSLFIIISSPIITIFQA